MFEGESIRTCVFVLALPVIIFRMESANVDELIELGAWPEDGLTQLQGVVMNARPWVRTTLSNIQRTGTVDRRDYIRLAR